MTSALQVDAFQINEPHKADGASPDFSNASVQSIQAIFEFNCFAGDDDQLPVGEDTSNASAASPKPTYTVDQIAAYLRDGMGSHFTIDTISYNISGLTSGAKALARIAFQAWADLAAVRFVETTGVANILLDDTAAGAFANRAGNSASINVASTWSGGSTALDSYTYQTFLHEIGHTLGLGHAGPYNGTATYGVNNVYANDTWSYTLMSYFDQQEAGFGSYRFVMTPMLADIVAVQTTYGINATTRGGDTIYGHHSNAGGLYDFDTYATAPSYSIYDTGGIDTIDTSGYGNTQTIDLRIESFSSIGGLVHNIAIGRGSVIENAVGGAGRDTIFGNGFANHLLGNGGDDVIIGDGPVVATEQALSIRRLYLTTLGRAPDDAGWAGWTAKLDAGVTLTSVASGFVGSAEFMGRYGALDANGFVSLLYGNVLHRAPDAGGLNYWVGMLGSGATRAGVVTGFSESAEFKIASDQELQAGQSYRLYQATLNRAPDEAGLDYWANKLDQGAALGSVAEGFVSSTEFQIRYGAPSNRDFVTLLYNNVLHRAPDVDGLTSWVGLLDGGANRTSVVVGFSESAEFTAATSASMMAYFRATHADRRDTIEGGAGNDSLSGGLGSDTYMFSKNAPGTDHVYQFEVWDTLRLTGFGYTDATQAISHMAQVGENVLFSDQGSSIYFHGASLADMRAASWVLV